MLNEAIVHDLIKNGRADRRVYTDAEIFDAEMQRIFRRTWIYIGHESQVQNTGDFITVRMGHDRLILCRHNDGKLYVVHNRCAHRGAEVCHESTGNKRTFTCPYHAWSYSTNGELTNVPLPEGYVDYERRRAELGLERVPRVDTYRGFIFASQEKTGIDLTDFLGPEVLAAFDNFVDRSPEGEIMVAQGHTVQTYRANWKFQIENSIDLLHPMILHNNAVSAANELTKRSHQAHPEKPVPVEAELVKANGMTLREWDSMRIAALPHGHCWMGGFLDSAIETTNINEASSQKAGWRTSYQKALEARHGVDKARKILSFSRHNTIVYPNLFINPALQQIRYLVPTEVGLTEQHGFVFRLKGAPEELFQLAVRALEVANSPASIVTSDDHEVFERMHESLASGSRSWIDWSRGLDSETSIADGIRTGAGTNEILMRNQLQAWLGYMAE